MSTYLPQVEKMISKIMSARECTRAQTIDYMLTVATGRLTALGRYTKTLPKGKATKGIFVQSGRKKPAPKSALVGAKKTAAKSEKPAKRKPAKRKSAPKPKTDEVIATAAE